jgi:hypothetical protein
VPAGGLIVFVTDVKRGQATSAVFVARNRFAVFNPSSQQVDIKDLRALQAASFVECRTEQHV